MSDGWLYLEHSQTKGTTRIPDDPAVRTWHEARGWRVADDPEEGPFVPASSDAEPGEAWVELVHPDLPDNGPHSFPNNPDALAGAAEAGWVPPNRDGTVPKPATARRRARETQQSPESPATERGSSTSEASAEESSEQAERSATNQKE